MGSKTAYLSQAQLDHALGGAAFAQPANLWVVISTAAFDASATGASCSEVANGDYARIEVANDATTWSAATAAAPSVKSNNIDFAFAAATSDWGVPGSVYLADAGAAGNLLYGADVLDAADIGVGDIFKIVAGTFVFNED